MNKDYTKSLEYLIHVKEISENNDWKDLQILALSRMGRLYSGILEYDKAMQCFMQSYELAVLQSDKISQIIALNSIAGQYSLEKQFVKSNHYVKQAYDIAVSIHDSVRMGQIAINIALLANEMGQIDTAEKYIDIALTFTESQNDTESIPHTVCIKIENLLLKRQFDQAEQLALNYLENNSDLSIELKFQLLYLLSKIYHKKENLKKAIYYGHEALNTSPALPFKIDIYDHLSILYQENNNLSSAILYKDSLMMAKDSLTKINEADREENNQIRIDLLNSERELMESKLKQKSDRNFFIFII
jgi:tetratricopeptide (TPR) repeat protein